MAKSKKKNKAKAVRKAPSRKPAKKVVRKAASGTRKTAKKKPAPRKAARKPSRKSFAKPVAGPVKAGVAKSAQPRPAAIDVKLAYAEPESARFSPKARPRPLMPVPISSDHPIAPAGLRPALMFDRELPPHDDEE